jgi:hypothetical protein
MIWLNLQAQIQNLNQTQLHFIIVFRELSRDFSHNTFLTFLVCQLKPYLIQILYSFMSDLTSCSVAHYQGFHKVLPMRF